MCIEILHFQVTCPTLIFPGSTSWLSWIQQLRRTQWKSCVVQIQAKDGRISWVNVDATSDWIPTSSDRSFTTPRDCGKQSEKPLLLLLYYVVDIKYCSFSFSLKKQEKQNKGISQLPQCNIFFKSWLLIINPQHLNNRFMTPHFEIVIIIIIKPISWYTNRGHLCCGMFTFCTLLSEFISCSWQVDSVACVWIRFIL